AALLAAQAVSTAERQRFDEIRTRVERGEQISADDRQFAQGVMARLQKMIVGEPREFTGLVPLPDLADKQYQGEDGGLYPGGRNTPPAQHLAEGVRLAKSIAPIDGRIVFLTIGMSNTTQETQAFLKLAAQDREINPAVTLVDGAQGGQTARVTADP